MPVRFNIRWVLILIITVSVVSACDKNHAPIISGINCTPDIRSAGTLYSLRTTANDEDFDILSYHWSGDGGTFTDSVNQ